MTKDEFLAAYAEGQRDFNGADLRGVRLWRADLRGVNLWDANLADAKLCGVNLIGSILTGVNLTNANLIAVNLKDARMYGANLTGTKLSDMRGNMREIMSLRIEWWSVAYTFDRLQIDLENHSIEDWRNFTDDQIADMASDALDWWHKWKDAIFRLIEISPATPTGHEVCGKPEVFGSNN